MRVAQPAVLVGGYDWDEAQIPRAEFEARVREVTGKIAAVGLAGLVVYSNKFDNAAIAYLTNFVPKLDSAYALLAADGRIRLHSSGSPHMMVNAQRLTWVDGVKPLRDAGKQIAEWAATLGPGALGLWANEAMPAELLPRLAAAMPERKLEDVSATLEPLLRQKSPTARRLIVAACGMLANATEAMREAFAHGASARDTVIAAEEAAVAAGAQDVRVLASLKPGGVPTAVDYPQSGKVDPLLAHVAVRFAGYWAEGFVTFSTNPGEAQTRAGEALKAAIAAAEPGAPVAALKDAALGKLGTLALHPATGNLVTGIGLRLVEIEAEPGGVARLEQGRVYSLTLGAQGGGHDNALVSAMIEVTANGAETLWSFLG